MGLRVFPPIRYSSKNFTKSEEKLFQNFDLIDSAYIYLCENLVDSKNCYATRRKDVRKVPNPFRTRLELDARLQNHRPTKVRIQNRRILNALSNYP